MRTREYLRDDLGVEQSSASADDRAYLDRRIGELEVQARIRR